MRRDAARSDVERELADRDAHSVRAEIAQTEDARAVRHADHVHVVVRPVVHHSREEPAVLGAEVHAARAAELRAELLAHVADGGRVDERGELGRVLHQHAVVQRLVAVVQIL